MNDAIQLYVLVSVNLLISIMLLIGVWWMYPRTRESAAQAPAKPPTVPAPTPIQPPAPAIAARLDTFQDGILQNSRRVPIRLGGAQTAGISHRPPKTEG